MTPNKHNILVICTLYVVIRSTVQMDCVLIRHLLVMDAQIVQMVQTRLKVYVFN